MKVNYDAQFDVLYIRWADDDEPAYCEDVEKGVLIQRKMKNNEVCGVTITGVGKQLFPEPAEEIKRLNEKLLKMDARFSAADTCIHDVFSLLLHHGGVPLSILNLIMEWSEKDKQQRGDDS